MTPPDPPTGGLSSLIQQDSIDPINIDKNKRPLDIRRKDILIFCGMNLQKVSLLINSTHFRAEISAY